MTTKNIIILGGSGVGKSSLLVSLDGYIQGYSVSDTIRSMKTTEKPIVFSKSIKIPITITDNKGFRLFKNITEETVNIKLLDTAGQNKYDDDKFGFLEHELTSNNVDGIIVVHDLSDIGSLEYTNKFYEFIAKFSKNIPIVDIGNKSDIMEITIRPKYKNHTDKQRKIFTKFEWSETSARTCENVPQAFEALLRMIYNKPVINIIRTKDRKRLREEEPKFISAYDLLHSAYK
jgi:small GTP-binding protein